MFEHFAEVSNAVRSAQDAGAALEEPDMVIAGGANDRFERARDVFETLSGNMFKPAGEHGGAAPAGGGSNANNLGAVAASEGKGETEVLAGEGADWDDNEWHDAEEGSSHRPQQQKPDWRKRTAESKQLQPKCMAETLFSEEQL